MTEVSRITPQEAYQKLRSGEAIIVCAYDSEEKFRSHQLAGAISLSEFRGRLPSLSEDQEMIFYCAWSDEHTSARVAAELIQQGYVNAKALLGGVAAWQQAGLPVIGVNQ